jgi:hypothetical protein
MGAPTGWIGGWVPWHLELLRSRDCLAVLTDVEAFPTGVSFSLVFRIRPGVNRELGPGPQRPLMMGFHSSDGPRFGIGLADGQKVVLGRLSNLDGDEPRSPHLISSGGGGNRDEWRMKTWLWPLPPPGLMTFVMSWPKLEIPEAAASKDSNELIEAAAYAKQIWVDDENAAHSVTQ